MKVEKLASIHLTERCRWLNHIDIYEHMNIQYPITLDETQKWYEKVLFNSSRFDLAFIEENSVVAMTGLTNIDTTNGLAEFYIMVNPETQGQGYGTKATEFTINYAFTSFNIHKIYLYTNHFNERANNLYKKLGFQLEGQLRKHKFKKGEFINRCIYGLLKEDWQKQTYFDTYINLFIK